MVVAGIPCDHSNPGWLRAVYAGSTFRSRQNRGPHSGYRAPVGIHPFILSFGEILQPLQVVGCGFVLIPSILANVQSGTSPAHQAAKTEAAAEY